MIFYWDDDYKKDWSKEIKQDRESCCYSEYNPLNVDLILYQFDSMLPNHQIEKANGHSKSNGKQQAAQN